MFKFNIVEATTREGKIMKKIFYVLSLCTLVLGACDGKDANAQMQQSMDVGSPDGANMMMLEESYTVTTPANNGNQSNNQMEPLVGDPGVEVAPQPETPTNTSPNAPSQSNNQDDLEAMIEESITTTQGM